MAESVFDGLEETFLVIWCVFSLVRMFLIAKHHQIAKQNAQTMINFENIVVDTEFGGNFSMRSSVTPDQIPGLESNGFQRVEMMSRKKSARKNKPDDKSKKYLNDDSIKN